MTVGDPEWLQATWARLGKPSSGTLDGLPVGSGARAMFAAIDIDRRPHLLIGVDPGTALPSLRSTRALAVDVDQLAVSGRDARMYIDVRCTHVAHDATFAALVAELIRKLDAAPSEPGRVLADVLGRWRAFWSVDQSGMPAADALGLFGELWFLERWMSPVTLGVVRAWSGPDRSRHDLQWESSSVEVKTSAVQGTGGVVHRIASLDQLENPERGKLLFFSLSVADDVLARNTLASLVDRVRGAIGDPAALELLDEHLAAYGYNPAHAQRYNRTLRIISESLYLVDGDFPRLTRDSFGAGLPAGVSDVSYAIAMAACAKFCIATSPAEASWTRVRATIS